MGMFRGLRFTRRSVSLLCAAFVDLVGFVVFVDYIARERDRTMELNFLN